MNIIDFVTISTLGNAQDFGDLPTARKLMGGGSASSTRGVFGGGYVPGATNVIEYVTIAVQGNAADIGGYYFMNDDKASAIMRPSQTLNQCIDSF